MNTLSTHRIAVALLLFGAASLAAQGEERDSTSTRIAKPRPELEIGPRFLSAEVDLLFGQGETWGIFADLDLVRYTSRPAFSLGLRAGWEWADGPELIDYDFDDHHANLLGRLTANIGWMRIDAYGGYAYVTRTDAGFNMPERVRHFHLVKLGGEVRVMVIPHLFGLLARFSSAGRDPLNGGSQTYDVGGLGFILGWQP